MSDAVDLKAVSDAVTPLMINAGEIAQGYFRTNLRAEDKGVPGAFDPVTEADRATESYIRRELARLFPEHQVIGEEEGVTGPDSRYRWLIDPIDGTKAYVTGVPLWGVLLGLLDGDEAVAGWVRQPFLGETFTTGSYLLDGHEPRSLSTSGVTQLAEASMYTTHPTMFDSPTERDAFGDLASRVRLQRYGGDCYSYCLLSLGYIDLVVENGLHPYDVVALIPIVRAAGGVITNLRGESPTDGGLVIAAATRELHDAARAVLIKRLQQEDHA